ncbi:hypothetical protein ACF06X_14790 [Streptomyces sp. NPDC015346]|uniref:hypothetical protein n=1 Tax=Streptomyces sp. NPDC015346 TaxID=3364954 RepID=UPI003700D851
MKNTKRTFAAVALAGAALALSGASPAVADTPVGGGLLNGLGIAGAADNSEESSTPHSAASGSNEGLFGDGLSNAPAATVSGNSADQSIGS